VTGLGGQGLSPAIVAAAARGCSRTICVSEFSDGATASQRKPPGSVTSEMALNPSFVT
jgi:hypothetical protein